MPELPDVEVARRRVARDLGERITRVEVNTPRVLIGTKPAGLRSALAGKTLRAVRRHGKHLFVQAGKDQWLALHFGMTGNLVHLTTRAPVPGHTHLTLDFADETRWVYSDPRLFGRVRLIDDPEEFIAAKRLGPDALDLDARVFSDALGRRGIVKSALMDQSRIAGIGNVYSDEILYQAGIHPQTRVSALTPAQRQSLYRTMRSVLRAAIARGADPDRLPDDFITRHRHDGERCPRGGRVARLSIGGRSTYYCPARQPRV